MQQNSVIGIALLLFVSIATLCVSYSTNQSLRTPPVNSAAPLTVSDSNECIECAQQGRATDRSPIVDHSTTLPRSLSCSCGEGQHCRIVPCVKPSSSPATHAAVPRVLSSTAQQFGGANAVGRRPVGRPGRTATYDEALQQLYTWITTPGSVVPPKLEEKCKVSVEVGGELVQRFNTIDGEWTVCFDNLPAPASLPPPAGVTYQPCVIFSIGINNEWSFDDAMAERGCKVYAFDPSMKGAVHHVRSEGRGPGGTGGVTFWPVGLAPEKQVGTVSPFGRVCGEKAECLTAGWDLDTMAGLRRLAGVDHIDLLKIDIEGMEWLSLPQALADGALDDVQQLCLEIHVSERALATLAQLDPSLTTPLDSVNSAIDTLTSIEAAGFVPFFWHTNTLSGRVELAGTVYRTAYEYSFVRS